MPISALDRFIRLVVLSPGVVLDLLKRHSGIVWDPGRFRGIAPRRGREEVGEPSGKTHALSMMFGTFITSEGESLRNRY